MPDSSYPGSCRQEPGSPWGPRLRCGLRIRRSSVVAAGVAVSLAFNIVVVLLLTHGSLKVNTVKLKRLFFPIRRAGPRPEPYDLFQHIATYQSTHVQPSCINQSFLAPPQFRDDLGKLLESLGGFHIGVELGVQSAVFSHTMLSTWPSCTKYYLVDLWGQQTNYSDGANVHDEEQLLLLDEAQQRLANYTDKAVFLRMLTSTAATVVPDRLDFVYVDARHDQCGVWEDLVTWWPKLRPGGIMAGHDYRGASAVWPHSDWSLCENGMRYNGAVMGAVNTFAMKHGLQVLATWGRFEWSSWIIRKPHGGGACGRLGTKGNRRRYSRTGNRARSAADWDD